MHNKNLIAYWLKSSDRDFQAMDTISTFNIRARYDDYKMEFYKKCSKEFTEKWIGIIKDLRACLKENLLKQQ